MVWWMGQMSLKGGIVCKERNVGEVCAPHCTRHTEARWWLEIISWLLHDHAELRVIEKRHGALIHVHADDPAACFCGFCCIPISELPEGRGLFLGLSTSSKHRIGIRYPTETGTCLPDSGRQTKARESGQAASLDY